MYWIFWIIVYGVFSQRSQLPDFYVDANIVDPSNNMEVFSGVMMYIAETKSFRYDYVSAVFAILFCAKALFQFSFTGQFGPIIKMI
jgi:hypothetical protein